MYALSAALRCCRTQSACCAQAHAITLSTQVAVAQVAVAEATKQVVGYAAKCCRKADLSLYNRGNMADCGKCDVQLVDQLIPLLSCDHQCHVSPCLQAPDRWPKLVIVDSISALLSPVIGASQHNQGTVMHAVCQQSASWAGFVVKLLLHPPLACASCK